MKNYLVIFLTLTLTACGPSQEEIKRAEMEQQRIEQEAAKQLAAENSTRVAAVTCAVMGETRNMDAAIRVREMNAAREKIGGEPFLRGDDAIKEAFEYGLCEELVLNAAYDESLGFLKDAERERERIAAEQRAERERIEAEQRAERERLAAEKRAKILERIRTGDYVDFHGVRLDFDLRIIHLEERQQGRNMEVGDKLLEIRSTPVDITLISEYLVRDFTNDPSALSVTLERNGERKTRSIRIR
jgi:hypothetical protein